MVGGSDILIPGPLNCPLENSKQEKRDNKEIEGDEHRDGEREREVTVRFLCVADIIEILSQIITKHTPEILFYGLRSTIFANFFFNSWK